MFSKALVREKGEILEQLQTSESEYERMKTSNGKLNIKIKNMQDNLDNLQAVLTSRDKELNCLNCKIGEHGQFMFYTVTGCSYLFTTAFFISKILPLYGHKKYNILKKKLNFDYDITPRKLVHLSSVQNHD